MHELGVAFAPDIEPKTKDSEMYLAWDKAGGKKIRVMFHARHIVAANRG